MTDILLELLEKLEWGASSPTAPYYMGGPDGPRLPSCPYCGGMEPSEASRQEFIDEAIGHKDDCELEQAIKKLKGEK